MFSSGISSISLAFAYFLNETLNKFFCLVQSSDESEDGDEDIDAALQAQIAKLKKQRKDERFKILDSGVNHMLFMKTDLNDHGRLVYNILGKRMNFSLRCQFRILILISGRICFYIITGCV